MKETVLIVDDTPTNLQILVRFVSQMGYKTLVAEDGKSALQQLSRMKPDIILLDVMMPYMDGFETCRQLKANPETRDIPVLFMTALSDLPNKLKGFEAGAVDYLIKPVQKEEVIARLNTHLTLVRQRRELEAMIEKRDQFMRLAAHDLRNPLTALLSWTELVMTIHESEESQTIFQHMLKSVHHMKHIIKDFLALSILQQENIGNVDSFDLPFILEQVVAQQSSAAKEKNIALNLSPLPHPCRALGNADHTHQILTNYLSNAIKYSPRQTQVTLAISSRENNWRIAIQDQGPGIPPAERDRLFVEFAKISNRPTGGETSSRLGLAIVKLLAEYQRGKVGADFPESGGSIFWFELPSAPA